MREECGGMLVYDHTAAVYRGFILVWNILAASIPSDVKISMSNAQVMSRKPSSRYGQPVGVLDHCSGFRAFSWRHGH